MIAFSPAYRGEDKDKRTKGAMFMRGILEFWVE
jgi:hypothetical protein